MTKAFDFVCQEKLIDKLHSYGIRGIANDWLRSYLNERVQCVEITKTIGRHQKQYRSSYLHSNLGIPQGSILSPLLFLLYINDLPKAVNNDCILFADDSTLIVKHKNKYNLESHINVAIDKAINWLEQNNLKIIMTKTNIIHFQTHKADKTNLNINYKNETLNTVNDCIFLGITVDRFCNWKLHIEKITHKIDCFVYALKRIRQIVNVQTAIMAYQAYVASIIRYGIIIWGNSVDVERVFRAQKKCLRAIGGLEYLESCKPLFRRYRVLPLPSIYIQEVCLFVKKHPHLFKKLGDFETSRTRHGSRLQIPKIKLELFKKNAYCMSVKIFNHLLEYLKTLPYTLFRRKLQTMLHDKNYYDINEYFNDKL